MIQKAFRTLRLILVFAVVLVAAVGILYVANVIEEREARNVAVKIMIALGIVAAASLAVMLLGGKGDSK